MKHRLITVFDVALIVIIIAFSLAFGIFQFKEFGTKAEVSVDNKVILELSLNKDTQYNLKNDYGYNKIIVNKGKIRVETADCQDGVCVLRGEIYKKGESIVCLPHKMIIEIK